MVHSKDLMVVDSKREILSPWSSFAAFADLMKIAEIMCKSTFIPEQFRNKPEDFLVAMQLGNRIGADPMAILQHTYVVHGNPGIEGKFIAAIINSCGRYSGVRYEFTNHGKKKVVARYLEYDQRLKKNIGKTKEIEIENIECFAYSTELSSGDRIDGTPISIETAALSGWYLKKDSPWRMNPRQMLMYRSATYFGRAYCPELLIGMPRTAEELREQPQGAIFETIADDIVDVDAFNKQRTRINRFGSPEKLMKYRDEYLSDWKDNYNAATVSQIVDYCNAVIDRLESDQKGGNNAT